MQGEQQLTQSIILIFPFSLNGRAVDFESIGASSILAGGVIGDSSRG